MKTQITDFIFQETIFNHFWVTYTSPVTGKEFNCLIGDKILLDKTKNCNNPKRKDLDLLKKLCKYYF